MQGKVVSLGPGKLLDNGERVTPGVKKGDTVVYGKYSGTEVEIKNATHLIVRESELLGVKQFLISFFLGSLFYSSAPQS